MTDSQYFQRSIDMIREEWFPNHKAYIGHYNIADSLMVSTFKLVGDRIECLVWRNPDNTNYAVIYFLHRSTLFVTGDIGHAVYRWHHEPEQDLKWIAHCNYGYFSEKIEGLDRATDAYRWDPDVCKKRVRDFFKDTARCRFSEPNGWESSLGSPEEWMFFVHDHYKLFELVSAGEIASFGRVPNNRCIGHWLGLRMAFNIPTA